MSILNSIESVLSIIIIIGLGYLLASKKWFDENTSKLFSRIVTNISLPALMVSNLLSSFSREDLFNSGAGLLIPFISILFAFMVGAVLAKFFIRKGVKGVFVTMFVASNTIFIGLPVNIALFGEHSVPYALMYYFANTTFFWIVGAYLISMDAPPKGSQTRPNPLKALISPPLLGFFIALILLIADIRLPSFILNTCKYLGNLTTPLSLLFIGITIYSINLKTIRLSMDMGLLLVGRFIISPLLIFLIFLFIPIQPLMLKVFIIQSAMPIMAQTAIIAKDYEADYQYSTVMITATTLLSLGVIPVLMILMGSF